MKYKIRILCGLLALFLAFSLVPPADAAGPPTVSISSGTVKAGEWVAVSVSIKDNPGLSSCMLYIYYDTDVFTVNPAEDIFVGEAFSKSGSVIGNSIAEARENGRYDGPEWREGVVALWYNTSGKDTKGDGEVLRVYMTAKADALNGDYIISAECVPGNAQNAAGERISLKVGQGAVAVTGGKEKEPQPSQQPAIPTFTDVSGHWAYDYIEGSARLGYMEGYQNLFRPDDGMTRCEFVTALWRAMGKPKAKKPSTFTDLNQSWYLDAVAWAQENNIIQGTGGTKFEPYWPVSREQVAIILHRLSGSPSGMEVMLSGTYDALFTDSGRIHSWAKPGVYWAVYQEIYCGVTSPNVGNALHATDNATRAQIAVMLVRFHYGQGGE